MNADQRLLLVENIAGAMRSAPKSVQMPQIAHIMKADKASGEGVKEKLAKWALEDLRRVPVTK